MSILRLPNSTIVMYKHRTHKIHSNPYISFPRNSECALFGKAVSIYKVDDGYFLSTESNEFKPLNLEKVESDITQIRNHEFKPNENSNKTPQESETKEKTGLKGFEPLTCGLRVRRYAELSYRPT